MGRGERGTTADLCLVGRCFRTSMNGTLWSHLQVTTVNDWQINNHLLTGYSGRLTGYIKESVIRALLLTEHFINTNLFTYLLSTLWLKSKNSMYTKVAMINRLTAVSRGSGYNFLVTLYYEPAIRIEHYMQNGPSAGGPDRTIHANCSVNRRAGYTHRRSV